MRSARFRAFAAALAAGFALTPVPGAAAGGEVALAPGVSYRPFELSTSHGPVRGHVVSVDLSNPHADLGLLYPGSVAARDEVADLTNGSGAVAGVNGDFFNISEEHPGIAPTSSPTGPAVVAGHPLKGAVPDGQRFGPALPAGTSNEDLLALGTDRRARIAHLDLTGTAIGPHERTGLSGLNQYALPVGGVGVFTHDWGSISRARAVCGTDEDRAAPCSERTEEVVVRRGVVSSEADDPGAGQIPPDALVLVGRERGAEELEALDPGDGVAVRTALVPAEAPPLEFAVGATPILRGGAALPGLGTELAPRTAAGISADGTEVHLVVVDGRSAISSGLSLRETAELLVSFGATEGVNLDGGGSTTMAVRGPGDDLATVRNVPSDGRQRQVANGIGVFSR